MNLSKFAADFSSIEDTLKAVNGEKKEFEKDPRQFRPNLQNEKKEYRAVIRFLPQGLPDAKKPYFVERWTHSFKENGQWYFENCPSLVNKVNGTKEHKCPACESNRQDYNSKQEVLINRAKSRRVKKAFIVNILVIEDNQTPANVGKNLYWHMPVEIYKKIELKWRPDKDSKRKPSNPFCPINGYALELVLKMNPTSGYPTYAGSEWLDAEPIAETEEDIIRILNGTIDLEEFAPTPAILKPYEDLKRRFVKVTNGGIIIDNEIPTVIVEDEKPSEKIRSSISTGSSLAAPIIPEVSSSSNDEADPEDDWLD